jgi:3-oxoacyl-[acyl-carrier protein] reductase
MNSRPAGGESAELRIQVAVMLSGRIALVTGGGTGLGRAISLALAREGVAVAVNFSRSRSEAKQTVMEINALGSSSVAVCADISDEDAVERMVKEVAATLGPIGILVNNAGVTQPAPFSDLEAIDAVQWNRTLGVNVVGGFLCARAVVPQMRAEGWGRILNVASNSAQLAAGSSIPYVVSKAALISLTQCLARALAPIVNVNAVAPGWMRTRWLEENVPEELRSRVEAGELPSVEVADVAQASIELLRNDGITGQTLVVDGGEVWL